MSVRGQQENSSQLKTAGKEASIYTIWRRVSSSNSQNTTGDYPTITLTQPTMLPQHILSICSISKVLIVSWVIKDKNIFSIPHGNIQNIYIKDQLIKQSIYCDAIHSSFGTAFIFQYNIYLLLIIGTTFIFNYKRAEEWVQDPM